MKRREHGHKGYQVPSCLVAMSMRYLLMTYIYKMAMQTLVLVVLTISTGMLILYIIGTMCDRDRICTASSLNS